MVKHIILWNLKDEFTEEQKADIRAGIKEGLEGLAGQIPGLIDISVRRCHARHNLRECRGFKKLQHPSEACCSCRQ